MAQFFNVFYMSFIIKSKYIHIGTHTNCNVTISDYISTYILVMHLLHPTYRTNTALVQSSHYYRISSTYHNTIKHHIKIYLIAIPYTLI